MPPYCQAVILGASRPAYRPRLQHIVLARRPSHLSWPPSYTHLSRQVVPPAYREACRSIGYGSLSSQNHGGKREVEVEGRRLWNRIRQSSQVHGQAPAATQRHARPDLVANSSFSCSRQAIPFSRGSVVVFGSWTRFCSPFYARGLSREDWSDVVHSARDM